MSEGNFDINQIVPGSEDPKLQKLMKELEDLRRDGISRELLLKEDLASVKRDKVLSKDEKTKEIEKIKEEIVKAKGIAIERKDKIKSIEKEAVSYSNALYKLYEKKIVEEENNKIRDAKLSYKEELSKIDVESDKRVERIESGSGEKRIIKEEVAVAKYEANSARHDAKNRLSDIIQASKGVKNQIYVDHIQQNRAFRNGKTKAGENIALKWKNYVANFKASQFFFSNGLYIAVIIFFIICIILAPIKVGANLFTLPNILTIFEQCSTRMFYALGVAGLILLAGTDLSVGRMVAMGAVFTGLFLHPGRNIVTFFGMGPWDFSMIPMFWRVIISLFVSICLCVLFSSFSGFFTARLKIHPFITTLSTQLIIYGILFFGTSGTPVGSIDQSIRSMIGGRWTLGVLGGQRIMFPKLIIPAVIAIVVAWFIWNKTTFGKNMYAVGGNSEAAAVSGISVFWVTLGVFIMAGIFYGCGAFLEAFRANASAGTGQGYETDAIAACVVGGISFNGGIGKIGGAVMGVIIFQGMTYALSFLGIDTNLQFVFRGVIIIVAVALDSIKYLKKK